jgi:hypothetical protein
MEYTIQFDEAALTLILEGLGKLPVERAGGLWVNLQAEINKQNNQTPAPEAQPPQDTQ